MKYPHAIVNDNRFKYPIIFQTDELKWITDRLNDLCGRYGDRYKCTIYNPITNKKYTWYSSDGSNFIVVDNLTIIHEPDETFVIKWLDNNEITLFRIR